MQFVILETLRCNVSTQENLFEGIRIIFQYSLGVSLKKNAAILKQLHFYKKLIVVILKP